MEVPPSDPAFHISSTAFTWRVRIHGSTPTGSAVFITTIVRRFAFATAAISALSAAANPATPREGGVYASWFNVFTPLSLTNTIAAALRRAARAASIRSPRARE